MKNRSCKYLLNLPITAQIGDTVQFNSYNENGEDTIDEVQIIGISHTEYIYKINEHKIKIGFHKSRLVKIVKSKTGQTQLFN